MYVVIKTKTITEYLLHYSQLSVSLKSNIVLVSDVVCTLEVELLDMVVVEIVVTSFVATVMQECSMAMALLIINVVLPYLLACI